MLTRYLALGLAIAVMGAGCAAVRAEGPGADNARSYQTAGVALLASGVALGAAAVPAGVLTAGSDDAPVRGATVSIVGGLAILGVALVTGGLQRVWQGNELAGEARPAPGVRTSSVGVAR